MSDDFSGVTFTFDQPSYTPGQVAKCTIGGVDKNSTAGTMGPFTANFQASNGVTGSAVVPSVAIGILQNLPVKLVSLIDPSGRIWTVDTTGSFATATV